MNEYGKIDDESQRLWEEFRQSYERERLPGIMEMLIAKNMISHFPAESSCCQQARKILGDGMTAIGVTIHMPDDNYTFLWDYCPTCGKKLRMR